MANFSDVRTWVPTDIAGERIAIGQPLPGLEVLSACGSTRHWSEPLHEMFTIAAVRADQPSTATEWRTRGRSLVTAVGQLMNINAGDGHKTVRVHAPAAFDAIRLAPSWIESAAAAADAGPPFRFKSPVSDNANVFAAIRRLVRAVAQGEPPFVLESACQELAHTIVTELAEASPRSSRRTHPVRDFRLRRVREALIDQPSARPGLDVLERDTGLGKSQLCALFRTEYGVSIGQFWTGCRVAKGRSLLLQGVPAKYVAADLGFTDEAYFSRVFRRYNGLPPVRWVSLYRRNTRLSPGHSPPGGPDQQNA